MFVLIICEAELITKYVLLQTLQSFTMYKYNKGYNSPFDLAPSVGSDRNQLTDNVATKEFKRLAMLSGDKSTTDKVCLVFLKSRSIDWL